MVTETLIFHSSIRWISVTIRMVDDNRYESEEFFHGVLNSLDSAVILNPDEVTVFIEDEDTGTPLELPCIQ